MLKNTSPTNHLEHFDAISRPFTSGQAQAAGLTRWDLGQLVRRHEVRHVMTDLYVPWDLPDTMESRAEAAALVLPAHAVAVDRTAAWLWNVDVRRPWELDLAPEIDFFVLRGNSRLRRSSVRSGERDLSPADLVRVGDITVTTPVRTALDLACRPGAYEALAALDGLARAQDVGVAALMRDLPRFRGRRGVVQARRLVPLLDPRSESPGESFVRLAMHDAGLAAPQLQFWVTVAGVPTYRLDLAYPRLRICVEYDGEEYHSSKEQKRADAQRRRWLRDNGWVVVVVRKDDFKGAALDVWLNEIRAAIQDRSRR